MDARNTQQFMTTTELMNATGLSRTMITNLAKEGVIPGSQHGTIWFFESTALELLIAHLKRKPEANQQGHTRWDFFRPMPKDKAPADFVTLEEAGKFLGKTDRTLRRRVEEGMLKGWRVGGRVGVSLAELKTVFGVEEPRAA